MGKVIGVEEAINISKNLRSADKIVVLAGGCFDILHQGHTAFLENAKQEGDILFVALESDETVRRLKGFDRPVNSQKKRAENLSTLPVVDYIVLLPKMTADEDYFNLTKKLAPQIIAITEGDPKQAEKEKQAKAVSGKIKVVIKHLANYSTTQLIREL